MVKPLGNTMKQNFVQTLFKENSHLRLSRVTEGFRNWTWLYICVDVQQNNFVTLCWKPSVFSELWRRAGDRRCSSTHFSRIYYS